MSRTGRIWMAVRTAAALLTAACGSDRGADIADIFADPQYQVARPS